MFDRVDSDRGGVPAVGELGRVLHLHRLARGLSLRQLATQVGLSSHSGLVDYERGRRIVPEDLIGAYGRALRLPADYLTLLRMRALAEQASGRIGPPPQPEPAAAGFADDPRPADDPLAAALDGGAFGSLEQYDGRAAIARRSREIVAISFLLCAKALLAGARRAARKDPSRIVGLRLPAG